MGKGDRKTTRGKRWRGSYGKTRKKKSSRPQVEKKETKKGRK